MKTLSFSLCAVLIVSMLLTVAFILYEAGQLKKNYEYKSDVDIIFTFGATRGRIAHSRELFSANDQSLWIISDPYWNLLSRGMATKEDMLNARTISDVNSTYEEVKELVAVLPDFLEEFDKPNKDISIGLVSDRFHLRRIQVLSERYLSEFGLSIYYLPVSETHSRKFITQAVFNKWYTNGMLIKEIMKIILYRFRSYLVIPSLGPDCSFKIYRTYCEKKGLIPG